MAGRVEGDGDVADAQRLAEGRGLAVAPAKPSPRRIAMMSSVSRVASTAPWPPGVVGMGVGDQRPRHRADRVDVEVAGRAVEAFRAGDEQVGAAHG